MRRVLLTVWCFAACSPPMDPDGGTGGGSAHFGGGSAGGGGGGGGHVGGGAGGGGMHVILDAGVTCDGGETFTRVQATVLNSCGSGPVMNCHSRAPYDGTLDLNPMVAYSQLVNVPAWVAFKQRVAPGDPLGSLLTQKLTNKQGPTEGAPMPQGDGILWHPPDAENLRRLECWILQGAPNN